MTTPDGAVEFTCAGDVFVSEGVLYVKDADGSVRAGFREWSRFDIEEI